MDARFSSRRGMPRCVSLPLSASNSNEANRAAPNLRPASPTPALAVRKKRMSVAFVSKVYRGSLWGARRKLRIRMNFCEKGTQVAPNHSVHPLPCIACGIFGNAGLTGEAENGWEVPLWLPGCISHLDLQVQWFLCVRSACEFGVEVFPQHGRVNLSGSLRNRSFWR